MSDILNQVLTLTPYGVRVGFLTVGLIVLYYIASKIIIPYCKKLTAKFKADSERSINTWNKSVEANIKLLKLRMGKILRDCYAKGYRNDWDRWAMMDLFHTYIELGGNTDGEILARDFEVIPYKKEKNIPERLGCKNPNEEVLGTLINYINQLAGGLRNVNLEDLKKFIIKENEKVVLNSKSDVVQTSINKNEES